MTSPADLIIEGRVATLAGESGWGWAEGIAVAGGRIVGVGGSADLDGLVGPATRRWRLPSDTLVMPSITDAHLHLVSLLLARTQLDLTPTPDLDATLRALADTDARRRAAGDADSWLIGHGWSLHGLGRWPDLAMLERVAPGRPVALYAHDHHTRWVSRRAMALARITQETADPAGGSLRRDAGGRLTGILHETAAGLVDVAIPDPPDEELERELAAQAGGAFRLGHHRLPRSGRAVQCTAHPARTAVLSPPGRARPAAAARPLLNSSV